MESLATGKLCVKSYYDLTNDLSDDSYYLSMIPNPLKSSVDSLNHVENHYFILRICSPEITL